MTKRLAVIDCGTNSFSLLIADLLPNANNYELVYRTASYAYLAQDGFAKIGQPSFERGLNILISFKDLANQYQVNEIRATGTAALRVAANGAEFIQTVKDKTNIDIELISGDREAHLIYEGIRRAVPLDDEKPVLMMDIGGGSVEFIVGTANRMLWAQSFHVGIAVMYDYQKQEPLHPNDRQNVEAFLEQELQDLFAAMQNYPEVQHLVGTGTFDLMAIRFPDKHLPKDRTYTPINIDDFHTFCQDVLPLDINERDALPYVLPDRALYLPVSLVLIQLIISRFNIKHITHSAYSLKQGLLMS